MGEDVQHLLRTKAEATLDKIRFDGSVERYQNSSHNSVQSLMDSVTDCMGLKPRKNNNQQPLFLDNFPYSMPLYEYMLVG